MVPNVQKMMQILLIVVMIWLNYRIHNVQNSPIAKLFAIKMGGSVIWTFVSGPSPPRVSYLGTGHLSGTAHLFWGGLPIFECI